MLKRGVGHHEILDAIADAAGVAFVGASGISFAKPAKRR